MTERSPTWVQGRSKTSFGCMGTKLVEDIDRAAPDERVDS